MGLAMRFVVVITEMNIDQTARPQAFRYVLDAATEADAVAEARKRFSGQTGREPAPRALIDVKCRADGP
jgi:hypothetical protein